MNAAIDTLLMTADDDLAAVVDSAIRDDADARIAPRRTSGMTGVLAALRAGDLPDLVLVDTASLPCPDLSQILQAAQQSDVALITLVRPGEWQRGLDAIQLGAQDYLETEDAILLRALDKVCRAAVTRHRNNPGRYLRTMLDGSEDAVINVDRDLVVRQVNPAAARLFQVDPIDIVGHSVDELAPTVARAEQRSAFATALAGVPARVDETERRLPDGTVVHIMLTCLPVIGTHGAVIGACAVVHDVSAAVAARHRLERTLKRQEVAEEAAHVGVFEADLSTEQIVISRELARLHFRDPESPVLSIEEFLRTVHPDDRPILRALQDGRGRTTFDYRYRGGEDGSESRLMEIAGRWLPGDRPDHLGYFVGVERDVTRERAQEAQLRFLAHHDPLTGALNRRAFESHLATHASSPRAGREAGAILMIDLDGFKHHNDTYGHAVGDAILVAIATAVRARLDPACALGRIGGDEFVVLVPDADASAAAKVADLLLDVVATAAQQASPDPEHPVTASIGIATFTDASEPALVLRRADEAMYAAKSNGGMSWAHWGAPQPAGRPRGARSRPVIDPATGLPGRERYIELVDPLLARAEEPLAAYLVRLGGLELLDERVGRADRADLLAAVTARFDHCHEAGGVVGVLGDGEFGVVGPAGTAAERASVAERLLDCLVEPFSVGGVEFALVPSVGIAVSAPGDDAFALFRNASIAANAARLAGHGTFRHYDADLRELATGRLTRHAALRRAVARAEFTLVYQPALELATGHFNRAEALVRWHPPSGGVIAPDDFIPLAESTGLIVPLGDQVLDLAIEQAKAWRVIVPHVRIPVNLSAVQLGIPGIAERIMARVAAAGLDHWPIMFEVTESALMENLEASRTSLQQLHDAGFRVVLDDFGTGQSSLSRLDEIPVHGIKIDKRLIQQLSTVAPARTVVDAIVSVGSAYDLVVTAEGIEDAETLRIVREHGVDYGQGYYLSRPKPPAELADFLAEPWTDPPDRSLTEALTLPS